VYRIVPDATVSDQVAALPDDALAAYAEVLDVLQLTPWHGEPQRADNPDAEVRRWHFGPGLADADRWSLLRRGLHGADLPLDVRSPAH